jgi:hypothetical protein
MKPSDFFIGLLDFFAILIPGSALGWLCVLYGRAGSPTLTHQLDEILQQDTSDTHLLSLAVFSVFAYLVGHFVFMISANLDKGFDRWRRTAKDPNDDRPYKAACALMDATTGALRGGSYSTLKWCMAYVRVHGPAAYVDIERYEALQKLFRSFVLVAPVWAMHFLLIERELLAGCVALAFAGLSWLRYLDQRWKMLELTYATAAILGAQNSGRAR